MNVLTALVITIFFPSVLYWLNPFALPITRNITTFRVHRAVLQAYGTGLLRDIILASPRFGILGLSSALSCIGANTIVRFFSIEDGMGLRAVGCFAGIEAILDTLLYSLCATPQESSLLHPLTYTFYSCLYAFLYLSAFGLCKKFAPRTLS